MDGSNMSKNRPNDYLGVNKIGKQIRKSPLHQPNFGNNNSNINGNNANRQQPQPQVYNISKSDFRSIVQQLTGSPSRQDPLPRPPNNPPKHPSMRLQRIRPPPLTPINRPIMPPAVAAPVMQHPPQGPSGGVGPPVVGYNSNSFGVGPSQFGQPSPRGMQLSPISAYMQQLQNCISDGGLNPGQPHVNLQVPGWVPSQSQMQPQAQGQHGQYPVQGHGSHPMQPRFPGPVQGHGQQPSSGLLPNPNPPLLPSARTNGPPSLPLPRKNGPGLPSPRTNGPGLPSPRTNVPGLLPSPRPNGSGLLPSPTSDFLLLSPSSFFNNLSPFSRSPYPLLSPGSQFPPPLSPNFAFSPMCQSGFLGPSPQPPLSPGIAFPLSPSGFFSISSPRWRD